MPPSRSVSPVNLEPPKLKVEDPGARDLHSSEDEDDHFSDAIEGQSSSPTSPVPITRVQKVDSLPSHGEVPGTDAYNIRTQDAVPDQVEVASRHSPSPTHSPQDASVIEPIPTTVVEKVDPSIPSHGDVPGTEAHKIRSADAVPDQVVRASASSEDADEHSRPRKGSTPGDLPIPMTVVSKVDGAPSHGEAPGTDAFAKRKEDAEPDVLEEGFSSKGSPTSPIDRSINRTHTQPSPFVASEPETVVPNDRMRVLEEYNEEEDGRDGDEDEHDDAFGDDFDDFEEGGDDDGFGDFDDGFEQGREELSLDKATTRPSQSFQVPSLPLLNIDNFDTPEDFIAASQPYLQAIFPNAEADGPRHFEPLPEKDSIFLTERSASLYSQLIAPPPLQPPNWVRSRIRRLFLVSLGVPIDLDEILPASKQKKLVLPSTLRAPGSRDASPARQSSDSRRNGSVARLKKSGNNASSSSVGSQTKKRKGPPRPPEVDAGAARALCATTDAALAALSDDDLRAHVERLEALRAKASEVLQYWLQRKDGALGDKEAFEGVIENLVKHARKVRK